jgi:hypothetical protein
MNVGKTHTMKDQMWAICRFTASSCPLRPADELGGGERSLSYWKQRYYRHDEGDANQEDRSATNLRRREGSVRRSRITIPPLASPPVMSVHVITIHK